MLVLGVVVENHSGEISLCQRKIHLRLISASFFALGLHFLSGGFSGGRSRDPQNNKPLNVERGAPGLKLAFFLSKGAEGLWLPGAQEYYNSVFNLMASWDLGFVKVDDLAGHPAEIEGIRRAIDRCGQPILLSVSMGSRPNQGEHLHKREYVENQL